MHTSFNKYHLSTQLGRKPLRDVYIAYPADTPEQEVVLKVFDTTCLPSHYNSKDFLETADLIRQLSHQSIVPVLDIGIEEGKPYVVSEYLPYGSLRSHLDSVSPERLDLQDALNICVQLGQALSYAHQLNILHGNIKPANILFDADGNALLTDFGLAGLIDINKLGYKSDPHAISYMAPEQFISNVSEKSDQYALACIAYELITGRVPFTAHGFSLMWLKHSTEAPVSPAKIVPNLPKSIELALLKALANDPSERCADVATFIEAFRSVSQPQTPLIPAFPFAYAASSTNTKPISTFALDETSAMSVSRMSRSKSFSAELSVTASITDEELEDSFVDASLEDEETEDRFLLGSMVEAEDSFVDASLEDEEIEDRFVSVSLVEAEASFVDASLEDEETEDRFVSGSMVEEEDSFVDASLEDEDKFVSGSMVEEEDSFVDASLEDEEEEDSFVDASLEDEETEDRFVSVSLVHEEDEDEFLSAYDDTLVESYSLATPSDSPSFPFTSTSRSTRNPSTKQQIMQESHVLVEEEYEDEEYEDEDYEDEEDEASVVGIAIPPPQKQTPLHGEKLLIPDPDEPPPIPIPKPTPLPRPSRSKKGPILLLVLVLVFTIGIVYTHFNMGGTHTVHSILTPQATALVTAEPTLSSLVPTQAPVTLLTPSDSLSPTAEPVATSIPTVVPIITSVPVATPIPVSISIPKPIPTPTPTPQTGLTLTYQEFNQFTNLTSEGSIDWIQWGLNAASDVNHKAAVSQQISNYTLQGNGTVRRDATNPINFTWSNGSPTKSVVKSSGGIYVTGNNNGFSITVPANTTPRTLRIYAGANLARGLFTASLNGTMKENGALDMTHDPTRTADNALYTINYSTNMPNQSLTITYTVMNSNGSGGYILLEAATLQ